MSGFNTFAHFHHQQHEQLLVTGRLSWPPDLLSVCIAGRRHIYPTLHVAVCVQRRRLKAFSRMSLHPLSHRNQLDLSMAIDPQRHGSTQLVKD